MFLLPSVSRAQTDDKEIFWNGTDFNDSTWVVSQSFKEKITAFLYEYSIYETVDEKQFDSLSMSNVAFLLGKAKANFWAYEHVLGFLLHGYSNMGRIQVVDYLLSYPMLFEGEISISQGLRLDSIAEPYQSVRVGAKAPDFMGITIDNEAYQLYDTDARRVILVFWSTDCEYCHDFLLKIKKHIDLRSDYELVTFALAESKNEVVSVLAKMNLPGKHFYDEKRWESKEFLDYHVTSTPSVFLLDEDKTIICKPYDWHELKLYIKTHNAFKNK